MIGWTLSHIDMSTLILVPIFLVLATKRNEINEKCVEQIWCKIAFRKTFTPIKFLIWLTLSFVGMLTLILITMFLLLTAKLIEMNENCMEWIWCKIKFLKTFTPMLFLIGWTLSHIDMSTLILVSIFLCLATKRKEIN